MARRRHDEQTAGVAVDARLLQAHCRRARLRMWQARLDHAIPALHRHRPHVHLRERHDVGAGGTGAEGSAFRGDELPLCWLRESLEVAPEDVDLRGASSQSVSQSAMRK
jgi:hypothetical protein